ncbi:hypothetical protein VTO73DRAFT_5131 [Trametes versicolor]
MVTVKERKSASDPICDIPGPVAPPQTVWQMVYGLEKSHPSYKT